MTKLDLDLGEIIGEGCVVQGAIGSGFYAAVCGVVAVRLSNPIDGPKYI